MYARSAKKGIEAALEYYLEHGTQYVCLISGNKPPAKWANLYNNWSGKLEEPEEIAEKLRKRYEKTDPSKDVLTLLWWDEKPELKHGVPVGPASDSVSFITATDEDIQERQANYQANFGYINNQIISRLSAIEEKLSSEEEEEEEEKQPEQMQGIGALMANPAVSAGLATLVSRLLDNYIPEKKAVTALAGTGESEAEKLQAALIRLQAVNPHLADDLLLLADLAESNPGQFKMLLTMLRK